MEKSKNMFAEKFMVALQRGSQRVFILCMSVYVGQVYQSVRLDLEAFKPHSLESRHSRKINAQTLVQACTMRD